MNVLIFIFSLPFIILAGRRLEWAVMFLIAALPSYLIRFKIFSIPFTLLEIMILIVFVAWFIKNYKFIVSNQKSKIINRYPFDLEIILLLIISFFLETI